MEKESRRKREKPFLITHPLKSRTHVRVSRQLALFTFERVERGSADLSFNTESMTHIGRSLKGDRAGQDLSNRPEPSQMNLRPVGHTRLMRTASAMT